MKERYDILLFDKNVPVQVQVHRIGDLSSHLHAYFELDLFLKGSCGCRCGKESFTMNDGDILGINPHTPHEFHSKNCILIAVKFSQHLFEETLPEPRHMAFFCNSKVQEDELSFAKLRHLIALLVENNNKREKGYELRNWSITYQIMDVLYNHFQAPSSGRAGIMAKKNSERMRKIANIIQDRYATDLTLSDIASELYLSVPYLSRFFDNSFGMSFLSYLTDVRLDHALRLLETTDKTIEQVSGESGFPNSHSFVQYFKRKYDTLPSVYRRKYKIAQKEKAEEDPSFGQRDYLSGLSVYLKENKEETKTRQIQDTYSISAAFSTKAVAHTIRHTWRNMIGIGRASDVLMYPVQQMLEKLQTKVGFRYLRMNGILSDELHVVSRSRTGQLQFDFTYVDLVLDFLLQIHMKPFIQLTFMPHELAKYPDKYFSGSLVSEPKKLNEWVLLVRHLMQHLISRYSAIEVHQWLFAIWHQPDTPKNLYGFSSEEYFYEFSRQTLLEIRRIDPKIRIGAPPSFYMINQSSQSFLDRYLTWCGEHDCLPNFLPFSYYDTELPGKEQHSRTQEEFGFASPLQLRNDTNGMSVFLQTVRRKLRRMGQQDLPIYIVEWNTSPSQQDLLNDTCYKSCYIVKNILDNMDQAESFSYWSLTDLMGETAMSPEIFHGGLGLFTSDGIPKAGYYAFCLLSRLGDRFLARGEGWFAARQKERIQILLYNYQHFFRLYSIGERFNMTFTERYTPFLPGRLMDTQIQIKDLDDGPYMVREYSVSRAHGSSFDRWVAMGALQPDSQEETDLLESESHPQYIRYSSYAHDGILSLNALLDVLEVRLIQVEKA